VLPHFERHQRSKVLEDQNILMFDAAVFLILLDWAQLQFVKLSVFVSELLLGPVRIFLLLIEVLLNEITH